MVCLPVYFPEYLLKHMSYFTWPNIFTVTVQYIHCFPEEPAADQMAWFKHFFGRFKSQILYRDVQANPSVPCSKLPLPSYH